MIEIDFWGDARDSGDPGSPVLEDLSLDSITERSIRDALASMRSGETKLTTIVIAHRLSTILMADKILVLDEGRCVDSGRHADLLERCALYRRLYEEQFAPQGSAANC